MVTMKLLGNIIACDDKSQTVSIIDPAVLQKVATIQPPNEGSYLYSAYLDEQSSTIFLAYDSGKMSGIDSKKYTLKSNITLDKACMKFTKFHGDPQYVILACESSTLNIFKPSRNHILATFNIEQAIQEERKQNGLEEE